MSYTDAQVSSAVAAMDKYRGGDNGEVGAALVVVGLAAERASRSLHLQRVTRSSYIAVQKAEGEQETRRP
jgi:hypothetical protein